MAQTKILTTAGLGCGIVFSFSLTVKCDHAGIAVVVTIMTVGHVYFWFYHDPFLSALYSTLISMVGFYVAGTIVGNSGRATNAILFYSGGVFGIENH